MVSLTQFLTSRCQIALQRSFINNGLKQPALSQTFNFSSYVGPPEFPLPGTEAYKKSIERLQDPKALESLFGKGSSEKSLILTLLQKMNEFNHQNMQLSQLVHNLSQKVEKLEQKRG